MDYSLCYDNTVHMYMHVLARPLLRKERTEKSTSVRVVTGASADTNHEHDLLLQPMRNGEENAALGLPFELNHSSLMIA